ncbi:MAG TPA: hypothetical protein DIT19_03545 [Desulfonauticus sp.]|nr:hypothetical protein [Desulfonauticus sp.]
MPAALWVFTFYFGLNHTLQTTGLPKIKIPKKVKIKVGIAVVGECSIHGNRSLSKLKKSVKLFLS